MATIAAPVRPGTAAAGEHGRVGPVGRLGGFAADHVRAVLIVWAIVAIALAAFAPKVETALSGAGWQADGSESVQARALIQRSFAGLSSSALTVVVHSSSVTTSAPEFRQTLLRVERTLARDERVASVQRPRPGASISTDGHTAVVTAGAKGDPTAMVAAAEALKSKLAAAGTGSVAVSVTGSPGIWSDFNSANKAAMMKSELLSWPVTMAIIVLAFGSLVAAGLPLLLTILGLVASAGLLALLTHSFDISIWAMNFALMFSLALGIDYVTRSP
jgi:RND superfamily putative drug exporter